MIIDAGFQEGEDSLHEADTYHAFLDLVGAEDSVVIEAFELGSLVRIAGKMLVGLDIKLFYLVVFKLERKVFDESQGVARNVVNVLLVSEVVVL